MAGSKLVTLGQRAFSGLYLAWGWSMVKNVPLYFAASLALLIILGASATEAVAQCGPNSKLTSITHGEQGYANFYHCTCLQGYIPITSGISVTPENVMPFFPGCVRARHAAPRAVPAGPPERSNRQSSSRNVCDPNLVNAYRRQVANCEERKKIEDKNCDDAKDTAKENPDYMNQAIAICVSGKTVTNTCYGQVQSAYPQGIDKCP